MTQDITGFGFQINLVASVTFPNGILLTQFADDADPFDTAAVQVSDPQMGLNGDLITFSSANILPVVLNMIPQSENDINLQVLAEANRPGRGKQRAGDIITMTGIYSNTAGVVYSNGVITDAMFSNSIASSGRLKSKTYSFAFENRGEIAA